MRFDVKRLHEETIGRSPLEAWIDKFISSSEGFDRWAKRLYALELKVGGIGIHNVNRMMSSRHHQEPGVTGTYDLEDRDIFRPIQYCAALLLTWFVAVDTRYLVDNSCAHIEEMLKRILKGLSSAKHVEVSLGVAIGRLESLPVLGDAVASELLDVSRIINKIYRSAKHQFNHAPEGELHSGASPLDLESHLFGYDEAATIYFACRIQGMRLMDWMNTRGIQPKSMHVTPHVTREEFAKVAARFSSNIRHWEPDLVEEGRRYLDRIGDSEA